MGGLDPRRSSNFSCGFYPHHLAGSCHSADNSCENMSAPPLHEDSSGLQCLAKGGIFVNNHACGDPMPAGVALDFNKENAYYVSPLVIIDKGRVEQVPLTDARARGYRTTIEADAAIDWIKSRPAGKPWMATVSFSAAHTPWQFAPKHLTPRSSPGLSGNVLDCVNPLHGRAIQNQMTEAMDTEFGRILVETGLASRASDGTLRYDPKARNTVIVIAGDNGSLGFAVKLPFNSQLAKGSAYQAGVWVPLIVAEPQVAAPDREVDHMVNAVDLFQFFGELAGVDAHREVPRTIDSVGLLPYLTQPGQASLRTVNFSMAGANIQANGGRNGACGRRGRAAQSRRRATTPWFRSATKMPKPTRTGPASGCRPKRNGNSPHVAAWSRPPTPGATRWRRTARRRPTTGTPGCALSRWSARAPAVRRAPCRPGPSRPTAMACTT